MSKKARRTTREQSNRRRTTKTRRPTGKRRTTRKSAPRRTTRTQAAKANEEEPKDVMLSFRFDRETANWLKAAAFWTRTPGAQIVRTSLRKELVEMERRNGKPFQRPPE